MGLALGPGGEAVPEPEMGMDEPPSGDSRLELLAQLAHVDVNRAVGLAVVLAPDLAVELLARDDPIATFHQRRQQLELAHGEVQALPVDEHQELARAQLDLARPQRWSLNGKLHVAEGSSIVRDLRYNRVACL